MNRATVKFIAVVLMAGLLGLPARLSAKQRRGADLIVTRLDGSQSAGELIAVKPDSLLLLSEGGDLSVARGEIRAVRIVRRSRAVLLAGIGGAAGAMTGSTVGAYTFNGILKDDPLRLTSGLIYGAFGVLAGLLANAVISRDSRFLIEGKPEAGAAGIWERLRAHSRESRRAE